MTLHKSVNPDNVSRTVTESGPRVILSLTHKPTGRTVTAAYESGALDAHCQEMIWTSLETCLDPTVRACITCGFAVSPASLDSVAGVRAAVMQAHQADSHQITGPAWAENVTVMEEI